MSELQFMVLISLPGLAAALSVLLQLWLLLAIFRGKRQLPGVLRKLLFFVAFVFGLVLSAGIIFLVWGTTQMSTGAASGLPWAMTVIFGMPLLGATWLVFLVCTRNQAALEKASV